MGAERDPQSVPAGLPRPPRPGSVDPSREVRDAPAEAHGRVAPWPGALPAPLGDEAGRALARGLEAELELAAAAPALAGAARALAETRRIVETLVEELRRARSESTRYAALVQQLQAGLATEANAATQARAVIVELRAQGGRLLEEQDDFIAGLLEEHEAEVCDLRQQLARLRAGASSEPTAGPRAAPHETAASDPEPGVGPATHGGPASDAALREQVSVLVEKVDTLTKERERARELLLRLQAQRDDASRSAAELQRSLTPTRLSAGTRGLATTDEREPVAGAGAGPAPNAAPAPTRQPTPMPETVQERPSALARALAATDPSAKRQAESGDPRPKPRTSPGGRST